MKATPQKLFKLLSTREDIRTSLYLRFKVMKSITKYIQKFKELKF